MAFLDTYLAEDFSEARFHRPKGKKSLSFAGISNDDLRI